MTHNDANDDANNDVVIIYDICAICRDTPHANKTKRACGHVFCYGCYGDHVTHTLSLALQVRCPLCFAVDKMAKREFTARVAILRAIFYSVGRYVAMIAFMPLLTILCLLVTGYETLRSPRPLSIFWHLPLALIATPLALVAGSTWAFYRGMRDVIQ